MAGALAVHAASFAELSTTTLYELLRLRSEVFVVEQACVYADIDGRDLEPTTRHLWISEGGTVAAYLRVLDDGDVLRIGRVVTAATHRHQGLAGRLVEAALATTEGPVVLHAQSYLTAWYEAFGFRADGPEYLDDGIPHVPMRLDR